MWIIQQQVYHIRLSLFEITKKGSKMGSGTLTTYMLSKEMTTSGKPIPLWPAPGDFVSWSGLIYEWLNGPDSTTYDPNKTTAPDPDIAGGGGEKILFYIQPDAVDGHKHFSMNVGSSQSSKPNYYEHWFGSDKPSKPKADNWISRLGINYDSPLVIGFLNNQYTIGGVIYNAQQFNNLIGTTGGVAGGWMGFIQGSPSSSDTYTDIIHATDEFNAPAPLPPCKATGLGTSMAVAGPILSAVGMAAMLDPIPFGVIVGLGGIGMGIMGGITAAKC